MIFHNVIGMVNGQTGKPIDYYTYNVYNEHYFFKESAMEWAELSKPYLDLPEIIALSACIHTDGVIYAVNNRGRHHHVVHWMSSLGIKQTTLYNQGFLTSHGRYVDRAEGMKIAIAANQILKKQEPLSKYLYSEDVW